MSNQYLISAVPGKELRTFVAGDGPLLYGVAKFQGGEFSEKLLLEKFDLQFHQDNPAVRSYFHVSKKRFEKGLFDKVQLGFVGDLADQAITMGIYSPSVSAHDAGGATQLKYNEFVGYMQSWPSVFRDGKGGIKPALYIHDFGVFPQNGDNKTALLKLLLNYTEQASQAMKCKIIYLQAEAAEYGKMLMSSGFQNISRDKIEQGLALFVKKLPFLALPILAFTSIYQNKKGQTNA